ncbi:MULTISPECIES: lysine-epsilon-oxidase maturase LodB [unclassified Pseudoalteromonas]|uniref:lysine-epsilon-oxidase maturase LodB n=1 Tax=unclassified Pseudoalteromonas TaxID=194690 RepID=UPI0030156F73
MTAAHQCDVLVIGAGPGGASAALTLLNHSNLSVTVLEQSDLQKMRVGESVSSSLFATLDYLQLPRQSFAPECFSATQGSSAYWGSDTAANRHAIFAPDRATFQVDREVFDLTLLEAVDNRGGSILPRCKCKQVKQRSDKQWQVTAYHPEFGERTLLARFIIDASGRSGTIANLVGAQVTQFDQLMGVGAFFHSPQHTELEQLQLLESDENGWWYSAALNNTTLVATYFSDAEQLSEMRLNRVSQWQQQLSHTQVMAKRLAGLSMIGNKLWLRPAHSQSTQFAQVANYLPVGDAACAFDPISSMGLGFAMTSGCQAARLIANEADSGLSAATQLSYQQDIAQQYQQYSALKQLFYGKEKRWPHSAFWQRRQHAAPAVA